MKVCESIIVFLFLLIPMFLSGSCYGDYLSITELLNSDSKEHHIFTCEILKTYIRGHSYESIAIVKKRYRGEAKDTIYINSGGGTTAGGQKLMPKSNWLIFSRTDDSLHYRATVCDYLSTCIKRGENDSCSEVISSLGRIYISVLEEYESIIENKYSGYKEFKIENNIIAKGNFIYGIPTGDWLHYSKIDEFKSRIKRSEISYKNGKIHGLYKKYNEFNYQELVIELSEYREGLPLFFEVQGRHKNQRKKIYEYIGPEERKITSIVLDSFGVELKRVTTVELQYHLEYNSIKYLDGYYNNIVSRDSSKGYPLANGNYYKGARIGKWKFFNKNGELVDSKIYPDSLANVPHFQVYDVDGGIKVSGLLEDGKRIGSWKYYYNKKLTNEELYNSNGGLVLKTKFYHTGGIEYTQYLNNMIHGQRLILNKDKSLKSSENYKEGKLNGISIVYNENGSIKNELNFIKSREQSLSTDSNISFYSNGYLNGHFIQYHNKTNDKIHEGDYWNGYRTGIWIEYKNDGSYNKQYYPTDKDELVNQCGHGRPKLTEYFDKSGNLINSFRF